MRRSGIERASGAENSYSRRTPAPAGLVQYKETVTVSVCARHREIKDSLCPAQTVSNVSPQCSIA